MSPVGFIGLGKLGLPVATCMAAKGHRVLGFDPHVTAYPTDLSHEDGFTHLTNQGRVEFADLERVVDECETIFVAVQTPHDYRYEGVTRIPDERVDFDYNFLKSAAAQIRGEAHKLGVRRRVVVISTVLPGTMEREVIPILGRDHALIYNPSFIAMGTVIRDFLNPEFVLLGGNPDQVAEVRKIYERCGIKRFYETSVPNAELIKVSYNTFIGLKLAFANTLMEVCHKTDCDVDEVTGALKMADRRLISGAYLDGGMGDGGGCHPRDNIALSWLARKLGLSFDLFDAAMMQRERQSEWLAYELHSAALERELPLGILGLAYKPGSAIQTGSPALLVRNILLSTFGVSAVLVHDPHTGVTHMPPQPVAWLVGCKHPEFADYQFPRGSLILDPWRYIPDAPGIDVVRIGEGETCLN